MKRVAIFIIILLVCTAVWAQQKHALVIGNAEYTNFGSLRNPVNDANDVAEALRGLGFTVDIVRNGSLGQMEAAAIRLKNRLAEAGNAAYGFFYYAGHGVQLDGTNYLIPANASIPDRSFLRERAFSVQIMLDMLNDSRNSLNIVVLDACRDFPATWSRNLNRGLSVVSNPPANHIIMYATGAGREAADGTGRNGLFTSHLLNNLKTPGLEVNELFRRTMGDVSTASNGEQRPALYTDFAQTAYLGTRPPAAVVPPQPAPAPTPAPVQPVAPQPAPTPAQATRPTVEDAMERISERITSSLSRNATVAILYISANERASAEYLVGELEYRLAASRKFRIVARRTLDQIRLERNFQLSGNIDDVSAVSIGRMLGADIVITGEFSGSGTSRMLRLRAIDARTGQVVVAVQERI